MGVAWEDSRLFDLGTVPEVPSADSVPGGEAGALSAGRRLTLRNKALLAAGIHPATRSPLLHPPPLEGATILSGPTCGSCGHHVVTNGGNRWYHKCGLVPHTGGPGTDIRTSWPACVRWEPEGRPS